MILKKLKVYKVKDESINNSCNGVKIEKSLILKDDFCKEHLIVLYLNNRNKVKSAEIVHIGSSNASILEPSAVFKSAIINNCKRIIIFHNHPSGDLNPSAEDWSCYKRFIRCGEILEIEVLDSVVFNQKGEKYSLRDER